MENEEIMDNDLAPNKIGKGAEKKKWPQYCKTMMVTDSHGAVKELVFPKALDLDRPKRERTTFSAQQLERLEDEFRLNQYLVGKDRTSLANSLGLSETQVKVWFQNRRTKHKKDREKREEGGDHQAESQAAQNVLKLLEYKTAFGYNPVVGGPAETTSSPHPYEHLAASNAVYPQQVPSRPSSSPMYLKATTSRPTIANSALPSHITAQAGWFSPQHRALCPLTTSGACHSAPFLQRPFLSKMVGSDAEKRKLLAEDDLKRQRQCRSELVNCSGSLLQHSQTSTITSEHLSESFPQRYEDKFVPPYNSNADKAFPAIQNIPLLRDKHFYFDNSGRDLSYPLKVSVTNYSPARILRNPQFFSAVQPSLPPTHARFEPSSLNHRDF